MTVSARTLSRGSSPRATSGIADAAHGRLDAGLGPALAVLDRQLLPPAVGMVKQTQPAYRPAGGKRLTQPLAPLTHHRRSSYTPSRALPPAPPPRPAGRGGAE